ncbi:hypothetical protein M9H77_07214 [Catharanthus roseus]|uniref:Uncharacterized protein n=1 Tax=Catharanthus roseus TaxID=4058 RepID=A0ACC0BUA5_CATRO|nr:hypothetical protein M9H77_07214 [Catharanthus roseus]
MVVAMQSMLMVEATMDMKNSFLDNMMVMETSLLKHMWEVGNQNRNTCSSGETRSKNSKSKTSEAYCTSGCLELTETKNMIQKNFQVSPNTPQGGHPTTEPDAMSDVIAIGPNPPRIHEYYDNVASYASCVLGIEDEERGKEKELGNSLEDLPISPFLNLLLPIHEVSFEELMSLFVSYTFNMGIFGDGNAFLLMPCMTKCLSSHISNEDS